jgi:uncharacterized protein YktA (UPF0223 family)
MEACAYPIDVSWSAKDTASVVDLARLWISC